MDLKISERCLSSLPFELGWTIVIATASLTAIFSPSHWSIIRKLRQLVGCWNLRMLYRLRCLSLGALPSTCFWSSLTCSDHRAAMPAILFWRPARWFMVLPTYGLFPASIRYTKWLPGLRLPVVPVSCSRRNSKTCCKRLEWSPLDERQKNSLQASGNAAVRFEASFRPFPSRIAR